MLRIYFVSPFKRGGSMLRIIGDISILRGAVSAGMSGFYQLKN